MPEDRRTIKVGENSPPANLKGRSHCLFSPGAERRTIATTQRSSVLFEFLWVILYFIHVHNIDPGAGNTGLMFISCRSVKGDRHFFFFFFFRKRGDHRAHLQQLSRK